MCKAFTYAILRCRARIWARIFPVILFVVLRIGQVEMPILQKCLHFEDCKVGANLGVYKKLLSPLAKASGFGIWYDNICFVFGNLR